VRVATNQQYEMPFSKIESTTPQQPKSHANNNQT